MSTHLSACVLPAASRQHTHTYTSSHFTTCRSPNSSGLLTGGPVRQKKKRNTEIRIGVKTFHLTGLFCFQVQRVFSEWSEWDQPFPQRPGPVEVWIKTLHQHSCVCILQFKCPLPWQVAIKYQR